MIENKQDLLQFHCEITGNKLFTLFEQVMNLSESQRIALLKAVEVGNTQDLQHYMREYRVTLANQMQVKP